jgi:hypothetical protein
VYDRYSGTTIKTARFTPHNYYTARGQLSTPFGRADAYAFDFLSGWKSEDMQEAWVSDMAVILLQKPLGKETGALLRCDFACCMFGWFVCCVHGSGRPACCMQQQKPPQKTQHHRAATDRKTKGMLGFAYNNAGYSGAITAAGYPGESPRIQVRAVHMRHLIDLLCLRGLWFAALCPLCKNQTTNTHQPTNQILYKNQPINQPHKQGMFYRLKGNCVVKDADGTDGQLDFKTPTQSTCLTACSIAEQGQSGQPAYVADGANFVVRGVLSHGPPSGTCNGFDTYTEVDKMHFNFLAQYRNWTVPAKP